MFLDAQIADESCCPEWEALVTDDMHYWVPFDPGDYEHALAATGHLRQWAGRVRYRLRQTADGLRTSAKKVELVNSTSPLPTLPFII